MSEPLFQCQNCCKMWKEKALKPVGHIFDRVSPGEPMPAGECPKCGAVCHEVRNEMTLILTVCDDPDSVVVARDVTTAELKKIRQTALSKYNQRLVVVAALDKVRGPKELLEWLKNKNGR